MTHLDETFEIDSPQKRGGVRELFLLAYPVVLSHLSGSAMHVIDSIMVGRLGPTELAAVGYGGIWLWTALTLFLGTATGVQTFVSQADGAGDHHLCGRWTWQGFYAVAPVTVVGIAAFVAIFPSLLAVLGPSSVGAAAGTWECTLGLPCVVTVAGAGLNATSRRALARVVTTVFR